MLATWDMVLFATDLEHTDALTNQLISALVIVPLLVLLNAFFVAAEFALVAVRKPRIETLVN